MAEGLSVDEGPAIIRRVTEMQAGRSSEVHFRWLFQRFCRPVTYYFNNRGFSAPEAEELAQDVFLRVYGSIDRFRLDSSFETWLFTIVANVWKNALRSRATQKRQAETVQLDEVVAGSEQDRTPRDLEDTAEGPLDQVLADERSQVLQHAIETLPPKMQECALLRLGRGLKYREIAQVMQVSVATVKSQLNEAKQRLKPLLAKHFDLSDF